MAVPSFNVRVIAFGITFQRLINQFHVPYSFAADASTARFSWLIISLSSNAHPRRRSILARALSIELPYKLEHKMSKPSPYYDIPTPEYEERRHVFEMFRWINKKLEEMDQTGDFDTIYFERKGENVKKFIEEAIPVAYLGLRYYRIADDIYIQCKSGNQPYDAILEIAGFRDRSVKIEVTTTEDYDSTLRRQSLSRHGFTYSSGPIRREGRDIVSEPEMVETLEEEQKLIGLAFDRFHEKVKYESYDKDTLILVRVDSHRSLSLESRAELVNRTHRYLMEYHPSIHGVCYLYVRDFIIDEVKESDHWHRT
jgi:hypothetical protein